MPLQASLAAYKRGAELIAYCQSALTDAQQQVEILEQRRAEALRRGRR